MLVVMMLSRHAPDIGRNQPVWKVAR
jgi:hypothetical protein